jgi:hypothetical protein
LDPRTPLITWVQFHSDSKGASREWEPDPLLRGSGSGSLVSVLQKKNKKKWYINCYLQEEQITLCHESRVTIIDPIRRVNPIWYESDSIWYDLKINELDMNLFFYPNRVGSGSGQPDPTRLIMLCEVILFSTNWVLNIYWLYIN